MATKKVKSSSAKPGKAEVKMLRSQLASAESKRDKWKKRAVKAEAAAADLQARLKAAEKRLKKERKAAVTAAAATPSEVPPAATDLAATGAAQVASTDGAPDSKRPDDAWTVAELRAEARRRGIVGLSRKSKADLLAALK
jgi:lysophospholipase